MEENSIIIKLINIALDMRKMAYTPYSHYNVGAALLAKDGRIFTGCNIESNTFTPSCCAERTAIFKAVSEGCRDFEMIAIAGGPDGEKPGDYAAPCGVCRQVMSEFCNDDFQIIIAKDPDDYIQCSLAEILPLRFTDYKG